MEREARLSKLVNIKKRYHRIVIASTLFIWGASLYFMMDLVYSGALAVISLVPMIWLEWRQTRTYLTFNRDRSYRRLIQLNFLFLSFTFVLLFSLVALLLTGNIHRDALMWVIILGGPPSVLWPFWLDRKLLEIDSEHVTSGMLAKANRAKSKHQLDEIQE
ncbi:hypothetical protein [Exiguobacterium alkaliphilum]|uniref:Uncharacterized protein n=1 Tax=Exiguobacterium alkaliphilum TaxID=1428684 RepID=A0ABT2KYB9_9BACL|nr:hypothetical protein [Exiguobacterium alkaliphilum]MCT4795441.1 hypothetical protein [Exiguobacterium alkaliphilum]